MEHQHVQIDSKKARQFRCQSCGGELELKNNRSQYVSCPYCGSVADASSDAYKILTQNANPAQFPPMSFLKLGMIGNIGGVAFSIVGRTRWQSKYKEYWREEGEEGYSNETWVYDEWTLIGDDGTFRTIIEDSEGYALAYQVVPKFPSFPANDHSVQNFFKQEKERVREYGHSKILFFEGESTYLVQPGKKAGFSMYREAVDSYSAEWRYDDQNQIKEIEFFRERKVTKSRLVEVFKDDPQIKEQMAENAKKNKEIVLNKRLFLIFGILNMIIGIALSGAGSLRNTLTETIRLSELAQQNSWQRANDTLKKVTYVAPVQALDFSEKDEYMALYLMPTLPDSSECLAEIRILDEAKNQIFSGKNFSYNYQQGDTLKAEKMYSFHERFNIEPGKYQMSIDFSVPKQWNSNPQAANDIEYYLTLDVGQPGYDAGFLTGLGFFLVIISFFIRRKRI